MTPRFLPAISSMSLGRAWNHQLPDKFAAANAHGIRGLEIYYEDLEYHARYLTPHLSKDAPLSPSQLLAAALDIRRLCARYSLHILCLQPFMHFGGIIDRVHHARRIEEMKLWIQLAHALGTDIVATPSSFLPPSECSSDISLIVSDLREISSLGLAANPPIRFVYESLCWGTWSDTWEQSWEIVQKVDRPNFGLCLDTFNIAGRIWADPTSPTGMTPDASEILEESLARLRSQVPVSKIFLLQLVDAERISQPLIKGHEWYQPDQPARMSWSRNARCFPFEEERGAYLPVMQILDAITNPETGIGYSGYVSFELFSRTMNESGPHVPDDHAQRAETSWNKVCEALNWENSNLDNTPKAGDELLMPKYATNPLLEEKYPGIGLKKDSGIFVQAVDPDHDHPPFLPADESSSEVSHDESRSESSS